MKIESNSVMLLLCGLITFTSCDGELELEQSVNEQFEGISRIEVDARFLEVRYDGEEELTTVTLDGILESSKSGAYQIEFEKVGSTLKVELEQVGKFGSGNHRGHIFLKGPKEMVLNLENGSGAVRVFNVIAPNLEVNVGSGAVEMHLNAIDETKLQVGSGSIGVFNHQGEVNAVSGSGRVDLEGVRGSASIKTSSGSVSVKNLEGFLTAEVGSGTIDLTEVGELRRIKTSSGNITGQSVGLGAQSNFVSSSGRIVIRTYSDLSAFNFDLLSNSGKVKVGESSANGMLKINNNSAHTIVGRVSSGTIEIVN